MRILLYIATFLFFAGCKKQNSVKLPLHDNSFAWLMSLPLGYANNSGDTLFTRNYEEVSEYISENFVPNQFPSYAQTQRFKQTFQIDTFLSYQTILIAEINQDMTRNDLVSIQFSNTGQSFLQMFGNAEPSYSMIAPYRDSIVLNGIVYENIYSQSNAQQLEMFVNLSSGLVGFTLDTDTFNIVK